MAMVSRPAGWHPVGRSESAIARGELFPRLIWRLSAACTISTLDEIKL